MPTPPKLRHRAGLAIGALLVLAFTSLVPGTAAHAADDGGWAVQPSGPNGPGTRDYFVYTLQPGQGFQDTVGISNFSDQPLTFKVYARDAFSAADAGFGLQPEAEAATDAGTWIRLPVEQYTVQPGMRADIPFVIQVPPDAEPGDHAGGIIGALVTEVPQQPGTGVTVLQRVAARVYVRVEGTLSPALDVKQIDLQYANSFGALLGGAKANVSYQVTNVGNVRLNALTSVRLKDPLGRTVASKVARQLPELLPGGSLVITEEFTGVPPTLRLTAEVSAYTIGETPTKTTRTTAVWAIPWLALPVVILGVVIVAVWLVRRRRGRAPVTEPTPPVPPRERVDA